MELKTILSAISAGFALIAAGLWIYASFVTVDPDDPKWATKGILINIPDDAGRNIDVLGTAKKQSYFNGWAAIAAAAAAIFQAALVFC